MLKFTYKGSFLTTKKAYQKLSFENPHGEHMLWCLLYILKLLFLVNVKISILGGVLKFFKLIVFGLILAKFGSFGQFWANLATMAMAESMPLFEKKIPKTMSKNLLTNWKYNSMPKIPKFHIWNSQSFRG
jgi:hypothetical protein